MALNLQDPAKEMTVQEQKIANYLTELGLRWEPQREFGKYTVDFWIDEIKTVIEADGPYGHFSRKEEDRTEFLFTQGVKRVLRIAETSKQAIQHELDLMLGVIEGNEEWD